jgi:prepilin peptidase CpaA
MFELEFLWIGVLVFTGSAAFYDHRTGHIPNRLVWLGLSLGAIEQLAATLAHLGPERVLTVGVVNVVSGLIFCGAVPLLLFELRLLGGGDVKLLGALGAFLGPSLGLEVCFAAFVVAALYVSGRLIHAGVLIQTSSAWARRCLLRSSHRGEAAPNPAPEPSSIAFAPCVFFAAIIIAFTHWGQT